AGESRPSTCGARTMRSTATWTGSVADVLNGLVIQLRGFESLQAAEYAYPQWGRILDRAADRACAVARQGGGLPGAAEVAAWLAARMEEGVYTGPAGEPLRSEVMRCVERIRRCVG